MDLLELADRVEGLSGSCHKTDYLIADAVTAITTLSARVGELEDVLLDLVEWPLTGPEPSRLWDAARKALDK